MATRTTTLLRHPLHEDHPLEYRDFLNHCTAPVCYLCNWEISADGYACQGDCDSHYYHKGCAETSNRIDHHPLHPDHTLTLLHRPSPFTYYVCSLCSILCGSLFRCEECNFNLDIRCALSTLSVHGGGSLGGTIPKQIDLPFHPHRLTSFSTRHHFVVEGDCVICKKFVEGDGYMCLGDECQFILHKRCVQDLFGDEYRNNQDISCVSSTLLDWGSSDRKTPKWISLPLHNHLLTSFSTRYDFVKASDCVICKASVDGEGDGYVCLHWKCKFRIHKRCVHDLYYTDGTKAPRVYHGHLLKTFLGEGTCSRRCVKCGSDESSGEFIGCASCRVFYCRDCVKVPEIIQYPHHPDHNLILLINSLGNNNPYCYSCSLSVEDELCYGCPFCEFFVDMECALRVLASCGEGMRAEIEFSWHQHQLLLCYTPEYDVSLCSRCEDKSDGPMYSCKEKDCKLQLHKRCIEIESTRIHPHHPDHTLTLCNKADFQSCKACSETICYLMYLCEICAFYIHAKCADHSPTRKHPLHEHKLLHLDKALFRKCNRQCTGISSPYFRCVPCDFNLHEECMELPPKVLNTKIHWHTLTLHEYYVEDDTGEYYCDHCEERRDERLGVYVCGLCTQRWAFHIECVLPELQKVCVKEQNTAEIERLTGDIKRREEEVGEVERKLEEMKRELEEQRKKLAAMTGQK